MKKLFERLWPRRSPRPAPAPRPAARPWLERLEDRTLLNAGALDPTFGNGGVVVENSPPIYGDRWVLGVQPDGKLLEAGSGSNGQGLVVVRENADGSLDQTFLGADGNPYPITGYFTPAAVVVQPDGKILVAGQDDGPTFNGAAEFFVARFNSDGTLDTSFGDGGTVVTQIGQQDNVAGMVLQSDGKIVLAGTADSHFALVRYNADGSPDATFGVGGMVVTPIVGFQDFANGIALQSDGKIVVAGKIVESISTSDVGVVRYNTDGTLDATFGNGGIVDTPFAGENSEAMGVAVQANGDVVVVGEVTNANSPFAVAMARYTPDGQLDATFGDSGRVVTDIYVNPVSGAASGWLYRPTARSCWERRALRCKAGRAAAKDLPFSIP